MKWSLHLLATFTTNQWRKMFWICFQSHWWSFNIKCFEFAFSHWCSFNILSMLAKLSPPRKHSLITRLLYSLKKKKKKGSVYSTKTQNNESKITAPQRYNGHFSVSPGKYRLSPSKKLPGLAFTRIRASKVSYTYVCTCVSVCLVGWGGCKIDTKWILHTSALVQVVSNSSRLFAMKLDSVNCFSMEEDNSLCHALSMCQKQSFLPPC